MMARPTSARRSTPASAPRTSRRWSTTWPGDWTIRSTAPRRAMAGRSARPMIFRPLVSQSTITTFASIPVTGGFEPISGSDQFGNTFDDWGNRFTCDESHPLSQPVLPRRALARNPFLTISSAVEDIHRWLRTDLPDQPDRALASDPFEPPDCLWRPVGRIGGCQPPRGRRRRRRYGLPWQRISR